MGGNPARRRSSTTNPANFDEVVARTPKSTREEMRMAISAAKAAFPAWRDTPAPVRGRVLGKATLLMDQQKEELARLLTREEGKTLKDSLGEVQKSINILEFMTGEARRLGGETLPSELPRNFAYNREMPAGRCRRDHSVEFSRIDSRLEIGAGPRRRKHGRAETSGNHSADGISSRANF